MQTEEPPQFRFNLQVLIILLVTAIALAIPLAGVIITGKSLLQHKKELPPEAIAPLEKSLTDAADKHMPGPVMLEEGIGGISLQTASIEQEEQRVKELVKAYGGTMLPPENDKGKVRILAQIPTSKAAEFIDACKSPVKKVADIKDIPSGESCKLLTITIEEKKP